MARITLLILLLCLSVSGLMAQDPVTPKIDTPSPPVRPVQNNMSRLNDSIGLQPAIDTTIVVRPPADTAWLTVARKLDQHGLLRLATERNHLFSLNAPSTLLHSDRKVFRGKEPLFYTVITILLFFALVRTSFPKYLIDLFRVAFRTTSKQRQSAEQLVQAPLPSMLLNILFVTSGGLYLAFVLSHIYTGITISFWLLFLYCSTGLVLVYVVKFVTLKLSGWLFNISATTDGYIFIVFMINKIIGIYLLPFLVLLAFTDSTLFEVAFALSYIGVFGLLFYRLVLAYGLVQSHMRLNPFHFFLYLCAFEVIPLFLIYKALMLWF